MEARRQFSIEPDVAADLDALAARIHALLARTRCRSGRSAIGEHGFTIRARYGRRLVALLLSLDLFGYFSTVGIRIRVQRRDEDERGALLQLRVWPTDEVWGEREQWHSTQSPGERCGDALQIHRVARRIEHVLLRERIATPLAGAPDRASTLTTVSLVCGGAGALVALLGAGTGVGTIVAVTLGLVAIFTAGAARDRVTSRRGKRHANTAMWTGIATVAFSATAFVAVAIGA